MTEESSTTSQLSADMTTTGMTQITGVNTATSSSSLGIEFYFQCAVVVIGVVGTATNGLVLYALIASKQHKKHVLIVNQNALDLFTSFTMAVSYSIKLCNIQLIGSAGYWLCTLILSANFFWCGMMGSVINLAAVTVERYLKVVHSAWSQNKLRNWMIYSAMTFAWVGGFIWHSAFMFTSTAVIDGVCYEYVIVQSEVARKFHDLLQFVSFYVIILFIFIFCYWRILVVIRRQAKVMAGHAAAGPSTAQTHAQAQSHKIQYNVIKTLIFVSALFSVSWLPCYIYTIDVAMSSKPIDVGFYITIVVAFLYTCTNPFIYATKFDPVREVLLRLIPCKKNSG